MVYGVRKVSEFIESEDCACEETYKDEHVWMNIPDKRGRQRVVVIGGGFGGLTLARKLKDENFQIVLIDKSNHHVFQPLLYQVSTAAIEPSTISFPFRNIFRGRECFHIRACEALRVDPKENILYTTIGKLTFDHLVIATGADTNYFGNKNLALYTMALKKTSEALYNRNQILESFELALSTNSAEERQRLMTFVVVGGGATGVELAGALAEMKKFVLPRDYPDLDANLMRIVVVSSSSCLLPAFKEKSSKEAADYLTSRKVELLFNTRVEDFSNGILKLKNGDIHTYNVFWAAGVRANSLEGFDKELYGPGNRLIVDQFNRVKGFDRIYAIGDTAYFPTQKYPNGLPQVAQPAMQQATNIAYNLKKMINSEPLKEFKYFDKGQMATIGKSHAVVEIGSFCFGGILGWLLWLGLHLFYILGVKNRIVIFMDWFLSYLTYSNALQLIVLPLRKKRHTISIRKDEALCSNPVKDTPDIPKAPGDTAS